MIRGTKVTLINKDNLSKESVNYIKQAEKEFKKSLNLGDSFIVDELSEFDDSETIGFDHYYTKGKKIKSIKLVGINYFHPIERFELTK